MNEIIPDVFLRGCRRETMHVKTNYMKEAFIPSSHSRDDGDYDVSTNRHDIGNEALRILAMDSSNAKGGVLYGRASKLLAPLRGLSVSSFGDKPHLPDIADKLLTDVIYFEDPEKIIPFENNPYHWSLIFAKELTINPKNPGAMNQALLRAIANKMVQGADLKVISRDTLDTLLQDPGFDPQMEI